MKIRIESTDENLVNDFLIKYIKPVKNQNYKIDDFGEYEKNNEKWTYYEISNIEIKI